MVFIPKNNSPEIFEPSKKSIDFPSATITPQLSPVLDFRLFTSVAVRCDHFNAMLIAKTIIKWIAVIRFVANDFCRLFQGKAFANRILKQFHFMGRRAFNANGYRNTRRVCDGHDIGAFAAFRLADSTGPPFAGEKLPSINASRMSILPRPCRSSASAWTIRRKTPCRTHGKSFQGASVRKINKNPLRIFRGTQPGRPLGCLSGVNNLTIGSIRCHCSTVTSILIVCVIDSLWLLFEAAYSNNI